MTTVFILVTIDPDTKQPDGLPRFFPALTIITNNLYYDEELSSLYFS